MPAALIRLAASALYGSLALVTGKWKCEYYYLDDRIRLFDRKNDPGETKNLADDREHADIVSRFSRALLLLRSGMSDANALKRTTGPGGPVAMRVVNRVKRENGNNNEINVENMLRGGGV